MTATTCQSFLGCSIDDDREFAMGDYEGGVAKWCTGCGDHAIYTAVKRILELEQLPPEQTVMVSGIGCSSRFPHYFKTYGFHTLHGRALPMATGIKLRRPDLHVFVATGDGDCCSIGAGHWLHTIRYNPNIVVLLFDNGAYGLTKNQTSPTAPKGFPSNTQPRGALLEPLNPLTATLGITNASFVAQTADWIPDHLYETIHAGYRHKGLAFIRILQRCPQYTGAIYAEAVRDPNLAEMMVHPDGIDISGISDLYKNHVYHDPSDLVEAHRQAADPARLLFGLFYHNESAPRLEEVRSVPSRSVEEKIEILNTELDRYAV